MQLAWEVASAFGGSPPPAASSFVSRWADPELRNDDSTVKNALAIRDLVGDRQTLRLVADVFDFNEELIDKILAEKSADSQSKFDAIVSSMPIFGADIDEGESL